MKELLESGGGLPFASTVKEGPLCFCFLKPPFPQSALQKQETLFLPQSQFGSYATDLGPQSGSDFQTCAHTPHKVTLVLDLCALTAGAHS